MAFRGHEKLRTASWWMIMVWLLFHAAISSNNRHVLDAPFLEAAQAHDFERQRDLIRHGADINARSKKYNGKTALLNVVAYDYDVQDPLTRVGENAAALAELRFLLKQGADPNVRDNNGNTALTLAAISKERQVIRILKEQSATR